MGLRIAVSVMKCGQCKKRYSNPLTHVCYNPRGSGPRLQVKPRITVDCPRCKQPVTNPLTHVCKIPSDFRKRVAEQKKRERAAKRARARAEAAKHDYHSCGDRSCERKLCVAYREGRDDHYQEIYQDGFEDGKMACPREHAK